MDKLIEVIGAAILEYDSGQRVNSDDPVVWDQWLSANKPIARSVLDAIRKSRPDIAAIIEGEAVAVPSSLNPEGARARQAFLQWNRSLKPGPLVEKGYEFGVFQRAISFASEVYASKETT